MQTRLKLLLLARLRRRRHPLRQSKRRGLVSLKNRRLIGRKSRSEGEGHRQEVDRQFAPVQQRPLLVVAGVPKSRLSIGHGSQLGWEVAQRQQVAEYHPYLWRVLPIQR